MRLPRARTRVGEPVGVVLGEGDQDGAELVAQAGRSSVADHAEVDHADPSALLDEEVPRMRVAMEEAVLEDHLRRDSRRRAGELAPVDTGGVKRCEVAEP